MVQNLKDLMAKFSNEDTCREFLAQQRWGGKPVCPYCGSGKHYIIEGGKRYKCGNNECYKKYSVTVGSIFHASNIPLTTWFPAMYLIISHKKGISSIQLGKDLGVTQKTAWFMLHRIRESLKDKESTLLSNIVEIDEVYIGGKVKNMHNKKRASLRTENGGTENNKMMVMGMLEREGNLRLVVSGKADAAKNIKPIVRNNIDKTSCLITDSAGYYTGLQNEFAAHEVVNHAANEYVRSGIIHTNGIEGAFSMLKRSIIGVYHQLSPKHLSRYCVETQYRYNTRKIKDGDRFELTLQRVNGTLSYKELTKDNGLTNEGTIVPAFPPQIITKGAIKRAVIQLLNDKEIAQYPTIKEASAITGIEVSLISKVLRGITKTTNGYQWKYL
ncbi:MAG: IS1595 family transposase [Ferruginibacter sp.]